MNSDKILLSIDCGTTTIKVAAFDIDGNRKALLKAPSPIENIGGVTMVDFPETAEVVKSLLGKLIYNSEFAQSIIAITLTSQRCTCAFLDADGQFIGKGISWSDPQGGDMLMEQVNIEDYQRITGMMPIPYITAAKICWLKKSDPEGFKRLASIQLLGNYILKQLGAERNLADTSNASATGLFDIQKFEWSDYILKKLSITKDQLPEVVSPGSIVGTLNKETSEKTMIPCGTPLVTGGGDQQCSYFGCCYSKNPVTTISLGTSIVICSMTKKTILNPNLLNVCGIENWTIEGFQPSGGTCFNWLWKNILGNSDKLSDPLINKIIQAKPGSKGVKFYPHLSGISSSNPLANGSICGLNTDVTSADLLRSIFEGIAYETRSFHDLFKDLGIDNDEIVICGGYTGIECWPEIYCNILNKKVIVPEELNSSLLGAAIQGGVAVKQFLTLDDGLKRMFRPARIIEPDKILAEKYDRLYTEFRHNVGIK
ncbi:hypothetical protein KAJ27_17780 [bacterium]|nr:hypothetical protein [bacterium]